MEKQAAQRKNMWFHLVMQLVCTKNGTPKATDILKNCTAFLKKHVNVKTWSLLNEKESNLLYTILQNHPDADKLIGSDILDIFVAEPYTVVLRFHRKSNEAPQVRQRVLIPVCCNIRLCT